MNNKTKIAIIVEVVAIIAIILSLVDFTSECYMFDCLGKAIPFLILSVAVPVAIIDCFVIQYYRKRTLLIPLAFFVVIALLAFGYFYSIKLNGYLPEKDLNTIVNNYFDESNKYIEYFVHNDKLYYYKYEESLLNKNKGVLFKADLDGSNPEKICSLNYSEDFHYYFIYDNEVYYSVRETDNPGSLDYHNTLKRMNLDNCKEKVIINKDDETSGEWTFESNTIINNEILIRDYIIDNIGSDMYYKYNINTNKITNRKEIKDNSLPIIDRYTLDSYTKYDDNNECIFYINGKTVLKGENCNFISYDKDKIYITANNYLYTLDKETKEIIDQKELYLGDVYTLYNLENNYLLINDEFVYFDSQEKEFKTIAQRVSEELYDFYKVGDYNILYNEYDLYSEGSSDIVIEIFNDKGEKIISKSNDEDFLDFRIYNNNIYLIYQDKIEKLQ